MDLPEFYLLLYTARSCPDIASAKNLVSRGIDWPLLIKLAARHSVRPLLFQTLKLACWNEIPQNIQRELTLFNQANAQKNLIFTRELLLLVDLFEKNSVSVAAFKGPVLAETVYGSISLREFSDVDVIIKERDLVKAEDLLLARGYRADFPDRSFRSAFLRYQGQYAFRNSVTGVSVDLHWQLSSKGHPPLLTGIWSGLQPVTIAGRKIQTLNKLDLALFLAAHGTKEGWRCLHWLCDFAELFRKYRDIDWLEVFQRVARSDYSRPFLLGVALASTMLDAPAPRQLVNQAEKDSAVRALAQAAKARMTRSVGEGEFREFLSGVKSHSRIRHRLRPIATLLTTRTVSDHRAMPLPKSLWSLYYLTRPFRLALKIVATALWADK